MTVTLNPSPPGQQAQDFRGHFIKMPCSTKTALKLSSRNLLELERDQSSYSHIQSKQSLIFHFRDFMVQDFSPKSKSVDKVFPHSTYHFCKSDLKETFNQLTSYFQSSALVSQISPDSYWSFPVINLLSNPAPRVEAWQICFTQSKVKPQIAHVLLPWYSGFCYVGSL